MAGMTTVELQKVIVQNNGLMKKPSRAFGKTIV